MTEEEKFRNTVAQLRIAIAAVDVVLFSIVENTLNVFLVPINRPPYYTDSFGLPGGIMGMDEIADSAAVRHLKEKAHIEGVHIEQLYTFSNPDRDKRSRTAIPARRRSWSGMRAAITRHNSNIAVRAARRAPGRTG